MTSKSSDRPTSDGKPSGDDLSAIFSQVIDINPGTARAMLPGLLEAVRLHLAMEVGFLSRFDGERRIFEYVSDDGERTLIHPGDSDNLDGSYCQRVVEGRIPGIIHNALEFEGVQDLDVTYEIGIGAHLSVPVHLEGGDLYGTLCCFSTQPNETLNERDLAFMSVIADLIGSMLQHECAHLKLTEEKRKHLDEVIHSGAMYSVWQPVIDTDGNRVVAVEALARFNTRPYRPPNEWFAEAASVDRHTDLERNALIKGLAILPDLPDGMRVTCNLSGQALLDPAIQEFLQGRRLDRIVLEITEHDMIADYESLLKVIGPLREQGMMLAIDDFGAGYASFQHILGLDPDVIKLDMSLVRNIDSLPTAQSIVRAMIGFTAEGDRYLVAEGVETGAEMDTLRALGVTRAQGYLFHKPLARAEIRQLLAEHQAG